MISIVVENYLKTILKTEDQSRKASTSNIARDLSVADATVTDMFQKLQKAGLLEYKPYYGATLTKQGRMIALKILRRHRLIELFLQKVLGYGWAEVHEEAEKLEHAVSELFVERLDQLLNFPVKDPHGEVIPDAQGFRATLEDICLAEAKPGEYTLRRVTSGDPEFLSYLEREGLVPSNRFSLVEKLPFQGPLKIMLKSSEAPRFIGLEAARKVYVTPTPPLAEGRRKAADHPPARGRRKAVGRRQLAEIERRDTLLSTRHEFARASQHPA
ncbi:MAG: metal-dependent transcriptional regulator [Acidobacteria bacterium]|nr:metal-dependent transcriptional regulator [Acidobacteriota bacterium]